MKHLARAKIHPLKRKKLMKKLLFNAILPLAFAFLTGNLAETNAQTINGSIGTIKRGGAAKGTIVMNIPNGLHVNSSRPNTDYAIPTAVKLSAAGAKVGTVMYPRGTNRKFEFSDDTLNVYENRAVFNFNVAVPANFKGNTVKVRAVVRYQACTEQVCYPPKNKEITLTARVR
jgi:thiol:disulfide interchange protein